jgi:mono/diheme cytochrome c family protein
MRAERVVQWMLMMAAVCVGCKPTDFKEPYKLAGGKSIPAATLNRGKESFSLYCRACHGDQGNGTGPASWSFRPPPRDFTVALFKFAGVSPGSLPHDDDLARIVKGGLHGSAMLAWEIPDDDLKDVLQYLKTFSKRWQEEDLGDLIAITDDTWGTAKKTEAVERGKKVYHGLSQCLLCHPAYVSKQEIYTYSKELTGTGTTDFRDNMYLPDLKDSDYTDKNYPADKEGNYPHVKLLPPDFIYNEVRSVRNLNDPDTSYKDLYRVIAAGIGGTAMPQWQGSLPESDIWALVYYVHSLMEMRTHMPDAVAAREKLLNQPSWSPPVEPPAKEAPPTAPPAKAAGKRPAAKGRGGSWTQRPLEARPR